MVKNNFSEPKNHQKLYISRSIYFLNKIPARRFVGLLCTNKLEIFFFEKKKKKMFSRTWSLFHDYKTTNLGFNFSHKKLILWFSQG